MQIRNFRKYYFASHINPILQPSTNLLYGEVHVIRKFVGSDKIFASPTLSPKRGFIVRIVHTNLSEKVIILRENLSSL